jgi:hypothetical protein
MRRLVAGLRVASGDAPHREERHADPDGGRRDGPGDQDLSRVAELAPGGLADRRDEVSNRAVTRQARGETRLEPGPGGKRAER